MALFEAAEVTESEVHPGTNTTFADVYTRSEVLSTEVF
jgi:hypothetical protein